MTYADVLVTFKAKRATEAEVAAVHGHDAAVTWVHAQDGTRDGQV